MATFKILEDLHPYLIGSSDFLYKLNKSFKKDLQETLNSIVIQEVKLEDGRIIKAGTIIYRPLQNKKSISDLGFNHYGIVLGTTADNQKLLVDINDKRNVAISPFSEFQLNFKLAQIYTEEHSVELQVILKRVIEMQFALYYFDSFNCRQFVNYCVYGKKESEAVDALGKLTSLVLTPYIEYINFKISMFKDDRDKKIFRDYSQFLSKVNFNVQKLITESA
jgi:hypothetical protein